MVQTNNTLQHKTQPPNEADEYSTKHNHQSTYP